MIASEMMTKNPACGTPQTGLKEIALMMVAHDCGSIPIVDNLADKKLLGMITDRDIVCRVVAQGMNPLEKTARDAMSTSVVSVRPDASLEECCEAMERHQIRRLPVVDERGRCIGLITQAHVAKYAPEPEAAKVVQEVSRRTGAPSQVGGVR